MRDRGRKPPASSSPAGARPSSDSNGAVHRWRLHKRPSRRTHAIPPPPTQNPKFQIQNGGPPRGFACRWDEDVLVVPPNFALHTEEPQLRPLTVPTGLPYRLPLIRRDASGPATRWFSPALCRAFSPWRDSLQSAGYSSRVEAICSRANRRKSGTQCTTPVRRPAVMRARSEKPTLTPPRKSPLIGALTSFQSETYADFTSVRRQRVQMFNRIG